MELTPREKDKLLIFTAALLAERRKARGLKLNYPEAVALILLEVRPGVGLARPVIAVAVEERRGGEGERFEIVGPGLVEARRRRLLRGAGRLRLAARVLRRRLDPVQQVGAALERGGDGLRHGLQRVSLALAQRRFHLARIAAAAPRQHQRGESEEQQLEPQGHARAGYSTQR